MFKKALFLGVIFSSLILVGCNGEQKEAKVPTVVSDENEKEGNPLESNGNEAILASIHMDELLNRIAEKASVDKESVAIMLDSSSNINNNQEVTCSVAVPEESTIDDIVIEQIVEDIIKIVSKTENVEIKEDNIEITYTNGEVLKESKSS